MLLAGKFAEVVVLGRVGVGGEEFTLVVVPNVERGFLTVFFGVEFLAGFDFLDDRLDGSSAAVLEDDVVDAVGFDVFVNGDNASGHDMTFGSFCSGDRPH